ncbi:MAG: tetratricopeptide repeat protein, partial [Rhodanobacter sp.]
DSIAPQTARRMDRVILVVAVIAVAYFAVDKFVLAPRRDAALVTQTAAHVTAEISAKVPKIEPHSIAVLPFENLSADKANAYFADGMQDMILTKLAGIGELKVISRTSTEKYASHPDDLKTIAKQLGVTTILEGSVQKSGNQVLINVQLIDAQSDNHLWAEAYPRTLDNIFGVEGEVAQKVADVLKAKLTHAELQGVASIPTHNPQAWDAFLQAESLAFKAKDSQQPPDYLAADAAYGQAISLDPDFALAYAQRVVNRMNGHWFALHLSAPELADVKASADRALRLAPDLPESHLALGDYYYWGFRNYDEAAPQFQRALQLAPNSLSAIGGLAFIDRRTGQLEQALEALGKAASLAPRDRVVLAEYGVTYLILRRYPQAVQQLSRSLAVDPAYTDGRDFLVRARLFGAGDAHTARTEMESQHGWLISSENNRAGDVFNLVNPRAYPDLFDRHFDAALRDWDAAPTDTEEERLTQRAARIAIQVIAGRKATIQPECKKVKGVLDEELRKHPDSLSALQQASWVDVCLGRNAEAIAAARHAVDVLPLSKDTYFGAFQLEGLAEIDAHAGAPDESFKLIEQLLAMPAGQSMSIMRLKLDPLWDPLRKDAQFQKLIADGEAAEKAQATL